MIGIRGLARLLMAGAFVMGGLSAWTRWRTLADEADPLAAPLRSSNASTVDTEQLVKVVAGVQVVGGGLFALGVLPRVTALVLGASLVPTALAEHAFWNTDAAAERSARRTVFLKDAGLLGGLLFAAIDTGGRPSVFWSGRRAAQAMADSVSATTHPLADLLPT